MIRKIWMMIFVISLVFVFTKEVWAEEDLFGGFLGDIRKVFQDKELIPWVPAYTDIGFTGTYFSNGMRAGRVGLDGQVRLGPTPISLGAQLQLFCPQWLKGKDEIVFLAGPTLQLKFQGSFWDFSLRGIPMFDLKEADLGVVRSEAVFYFKELMFSCNHHTELLIRAHYVYFKEDGIPLEAADREGDEYQLAQHEVGGEIEWSYHYKNGRWLQPLLKVGYTHLFSKEVIRVLIEPPVDPEVVRVQIITYDQGLLTLAGGLKSEIRLAEQVMLWFSLEAGAQYLYPDPGEKYWRALIFGKAGFWF